MKTRETSFAPGALDLTEQAVHLLRQRGGAVLVDYYIGTLPFTLAVLFFWSDMSRNPNAGWYCAPAAAGLALLFIWMKLWQSRFCRCLWCALNDTPVAPWPWRLSWSVASRQALLHATGLVVLPIAAVIMLPMAWTYAFYQNLSVLEAPDTTDLKGLYRSAVRQAVLWPGQNHLILTIVSVFALFVIANVAMGLMMAPYLIKWLLGIETAFTISGMHAMTNTTFLAIVCVLSYLCVDPIIKALYTLRCFYGLSRRTGDDLHAALKPFLKAGLMLLIVVAACLAQAPMVTAGDLHPPPGADGERPSENAAYADQLDETIDHVLQERRFAWRLPREKAPSSSADEPGWLARSFKWLAQKIEAAYEAIDQWLESLSEWLRKRIGPKEWDGDSGGDWRWITRLVFMGVGLVLIVLLFLFIRRWLLVRRTSKGLKERLSSDPIVDINDETITADDLPLDQWLAMARELMTKKDYRQAMRAFYLSILSQLGEHDRLVIARYKSNRDYQRELARRIHAEPELCDIFTQCMIAFESAWYGMHPVGEPQLGQFMADQERIAALVQHAA